MVKRNLAKVETAGSSPVVRSKVPIDYRPLGWVSQAVRQRPAKPYRRVRLSYPPLGGGRKSVGETQTRAVGAVVAHFPDTEGVTSSNLVSPTGT